MSSRWNSSCRYLFTKQKITSTSLASQKRMNFLNFLSAVASMLSTAWKSMMMKRIGSSLSYDSATCCISCLRIFSAV